MQINSKLRLNRTGIPVLSVQSGNQLINEVTQKAAATFSSQQQYPSNSYYETGTKKEADTAQVYSFSGRGIVQTAEHSKGTLLNAFA